MTSQLSTVNPACCSIISTKLNRVSGAAALLHAASLPTYVFQRRACTKRSAQWALAQREAELPHTHIYFPALHTCPLMTRAEVQPSDKKPSSYYGTEIVPVAVMYAGRGDIYARKYCPARTRNGRHAESVCVCGVGGSHAGARPKINAAGCRAQQHTRARRAAGIVSTRQQRLQSARIVDIRLNDIYDWSVFTVQHASHYGAGSRGQRGYLPLVNSPYERGNKSSRSQVIVRQTDSSVGICRHLEISASEESPLQWVVFRSALTPRRLEGRKS